MQRPVYNALIRTHHITSQKKIAKLRTAAAKHGLLVLLRTGGSPGIMYVEGSQDGVEAWVNTVNRLRYKDYQLISRPALTECSGASTDGVHLLDTVKDFAQEMSERGLHGWWRQKMGFA